MSIVRLAWEGLLDLLAPPTCAGCDAPLDGEPPATELFCGACAPLLEPAPPAHGAGVAFGYGGPLRDAIKRLKYGGRSDLGARLGALLGTAALDRAGRIDAVVPVPLHVTRLRERGFDQASLLAGPVARRLGARFLVDGLRRARPTAVQASLRRADRVHNVRAAFVGARNVAGLRILCVDDVRTTGATLGEACAAILAAGARSVEGLALAGVEAGDDAGDDPGAT